MNKILVVPYSYTGPGRRLAQLLCGMMYRDRLMAEITDATPHRGAGPMRSFVAQRANSQAQIAIPVLCRGGAPNAVPGIGRLARCSPVLSAAFTSQDVDDGSCARSFDVFGRAIVAGSRSEPVVRPLTASPKAA